MLTTFWLHAVFLLEEYDTLATVSHQPMNHDVEGDNTTIGELLEQFVTEQEELAEEQVAQLFTHLAALLLWQTGDGSLTFLFSHLSAALLRNAD